MKSLLLLAWMAYVQGFLITPAKEHCFPQYGLGCYNNSPPFGNTMGVLPQDPGTHFFLYTRQNKVIPHILKYRDAASILNSHYNPSHDTKFLVHGYTENGVVNFWMPEAKDAMLIKDDVNVITVDYGKGGALVLYNQAVANARIVSAMIAEEIKTIMAATGNTPANFHLIGVSLGAQIVGGAGHLVPGIRRITGLDPAGPLFVGTDNVVKLDPSDALFVDVIHTDMGVFGTKERSGHADFYPNGGAVQKSCLGFSICDHADSVFYFVSSINTCQFRSARATSYAEYQAGHYEDCGPGGCPLMGYLADQQTPLPNGTFYLTTTSLPPYC